MAPANTRAAPTNPELSQWAGRPSSAPPTPFPQLTPPARAVALAHASANWRQLPRPKMPAPTASEHLSAKVTPIRACSRQTQSRRCMPKSRRVCRLRHRPGARCRDEFRGCQLPGCRRKLSPAEASRRYRAVDRRGLPGDRQHRVAQRARHQGARTAMLVRTSTAGESRVDDPRIRSS